MILKGVQAHGPQLLLEVLWAPLVCRGLHVAFHLSPVWEVHSAALVAFHELAGFVGSCTHPRQEIDRTLPELLRCGKQRPGTNLQDGEARVLLYTAS